MSKTQTTFRKRLKPLFRHWDDQDIATQLIRVMVLYEDLRFEYNSFTQNWSASPRFLINAKTPT